MKTAWWRMALLMFWALASVGCVKDYVTGRPSFNLMNESQEIEIGKSSHESVIETYGIYDDQAMQDYVAGIGDALAAVSHRADLDYHFYVVDSPVVNAFALPGGYIYFTRGILAHFNSEDELAGVMGHELGHVVARHGAEQYSRQQLLTIGLGVATVASQKFRRYAPLAQVGMGLLFLKFSRAQESESDKLGVDYTTQLGYDSHKMAGFFKTIARIGAESGQSTPNFLSTHPNPLNREQRVHELTEKMRAERGFQPKPRDRADFLRRIDGMVFGEDPRNGYHDKERDAFYHPNGDFQFPVPDGWLFQKGGNRFQMMESNKKAVLMVAREKEFKNREAAADEFVEEVGVSVSDRRGVRLRGFQALRLESTLQNEQQELRITSYFIDNGHDAFVIHGFAKASDFANHARLLRSTAEGFSHLTHEPARRKKPARLRIRSAPRSGSLEDNLRALGAANDQLDELAILNGMERSDSVKRGAPLKTIVD